MPYDVTSWFLEQAASPAPPIVRRYHLGYVKDQGPGGYDGVGIGGTLFVDGLTGEQAAAFDGKDDYLAIRALYYSDSGGAPYAEYPVTVEARFQAESVGQDMALLSFGHDRTYEVGLDAGGEAEFHMMAGALGLHVEVGTSTVNDGNTHAAAYRFDPTTEGGQLSIFVDGQLETQVVSQGTYWGGPDKAFGMVGRRFAGAGNPGTDVFNGTGSSNWFHGIL
ncbi:MAG TPA: LamG-like jellyroll fold domain-containing protein, partial [Gammaproteobacteria bacterium]|nr:LamG-like jellyroll fold domain-containing protein [Gammaproteobacteria bacterium]